MHLQNFKWPCMVERLNFVGKFFGKLVLGFFSLSELIFVIITFRNFSSPSSSLGFLSHLFAVFTEYWIGINFLHNQF